MVFAKRHSPLRKRNSMTGTIPLISVGVSDEIFLHPVTSAPIFGICI